MEYEQKCWIAVFVLLDEFAEESNATAEGSCSSHALYASQLLLHSLKVECLCLTSQHCMEFDPTSAHH